MKAEGKLERVQIDLYSGLPMSRGYKAVMVVTDVVTKYVVLAPLQYKEAKTVAEEFWRYFVVHYNFPAIVQ
ncbi:MAG: hypothetical protein ACK53Y_10635, partial [bacterium]